MSGDPANRDASKQIDVFQSTEIKVVGVVLASVLQSPRYGGSHNRRAKAVQDAVDKLNQLAVQGR